MVESVEMIWLLGSGLCPPSENGESRENYMGNWIVIVKIFWVTACGLCSPSENCDNGESSVNGENSENSRGS